MTVPLRRCLILANPKAGALSRYAASTRLRERLARALGWEEKRDPAFGVPPSLELLVEAAAGAGVVADVEVAPPIAQLPRRFREAARSGIDTVVAVGGDGTVRAFAQALLNNDLRDLLTLGILPLGTANNVAHSLKIPFDLNGAMRVLAEGVAQGVDVGQVGGEYFLEAAGVGLFADAVQAFGTEEVRPWQIGRVLKVVAPLFWSVRSRTLRLTLDGVTEEEDALLVTVANGPYLGEGFAFTPTAVLTDGLFDITIVGALSRAELFAFTRSVMRGTHLQSPRVRHVQAHIVDIRRIHRSHRPLPIHADDHIAAHTPATLTLVPHALRVVTPPHENGSK